MISWAVAVAATFNLTCTGTMTSTSIAGDRAEPYSHVYRIDLDRMLYCEEDCKAHRPIARVGPTQITLHEKDVDTPAQRERTANLIDRETGAHQIIATSSNPRDRASILILKWVGQCARGEFTGFPKFETKF